MPIHLDRSMRAATVKASGPCFHGRTWAWPCNHMARGPHVWPLRTYALAYMPEPAPVAAACCMCARRSISIAVLLRRPSRPRTHFHAWTWTWKSTSLEHMERLAVVPIGPDRTLHGLAPRPGKVGPGKKQNTRDLRLRPLLQLHISVLFPYTNCALRLSCPRPHAARPLLRLPFVSRAFPARFHDGFRPEIDLLSTWIRAGFAWCFFKPLSWKTRSF